jgi:hypothetical protein
MDRCLFFWSPLFNWSQSGAFQVTPVIFAEDSGVSLVHQVQEVFIRSEETRSAADRNFDAPASRAGDKLIRVRGADV